MDNRQSARASAPSNVPTGFPPASLAELTHLNTSDILAAFGVQREWPLRGLFEILCRPTAQRFACEVAALDQLVGSAGLVAGGAWMVGRWAERFTVLGDPLPDGPLLLVANHPGMLDAMALFAGIQREDLRVPAITRPFLRCLPNIRSVLIPVGGQPGERVAVLRTAARHMREGGAILTFPAGRIEPDPLIDARAITDLAHWSASVGLFARLGGQIPVVPVIVGGVIAPEALRHPIVRLRRRPEDQRWLAAIWQLLRPQLRRVHVRVSFGRPLSATLPDLGAAVQSEARRLIEGLRQA
ncbi:1-acyl-sn-glycerol-3-phosphate acyltransferase [Candidatus Chloroploca sp. Khr17]|uniref:1-acyl-sn-glycerol-3-phosphate acyltransferase n=1 Tax=Candidatus Chloroploca sp. Khr17 TaxID=2496869 RepID=UPI00101BBE62|nr:1-acyl-sn-glycerol-3-phosphate acyltransferase [Candidatus Chloroploca sp. Khr17]